MVYQLIKKWRGSVAVSGILVLLGLGLAACDPQGPQASQAGSASESAMAQSFASSETMSAAAVASDGAGAVAEPSQKPGASVDLASNQPLQLQAGVADVFNVELKTPVTAGRMHVSLTAAAPLNLMSELDEFDFELSPDGQYLLPITLQADENGRYYLNLQIEMVAGEQTQARNLDVIVQVGAAVKTQLNYEQKPVSSEEAIQELPAHEHIH